MSEQHRSTHLAHHLLDGSASVPKPYEMSGREVAPVLPAVGTPRLPFSL